MLCDDCQHEMREYEYRFTCLRCGYSVPIKTAVNKPPHPRLQARVDHVTFWSHPLEWLSRRPRLLVTLWVFLAWVIMAYALYVFYCFFMDPILLGVG